MDKPQEQIRGKAQKAPCYHCPDRAHGCHSVCEKYARFRRDKITENRQRFLYDIAQNYDRSKNRALRRSDPRKK